jgi:ribonuclease E
VNEDERLAAFKRGAPTVKSPADISTERTPKPKPEPKAQVEPKPARAHRVRQGSTEAEASEGSVRTATRESDAGTPADENGSAKPRSRNRGARGSGGGSRTTDRTTDQEPREPREPKEPQKPREPRAPRPPREPRQSKPAASAEPTKASDVQTSSGSTSETADAQGAASQDRPDGIGAPRKRRRRGGRGRGRSGSPSTGTPTSTDAQDVGADDEAPLKETPDTQRDDALPDVGDQPGGSSTPSASRRRRRGSRGSGASKTGEGEQSSPDKANGANADGRAKDDGGKAEGGTRQKAKPKTMTAEERVAAGGPTRGVRSSRSRTGRGDGRRRREPLIVPPRITDKVMVITERGERDQIAVLEEDVLVQHYVTRTGARSMVGNVYLGRVQNVLPGMEAAFVDIGRGRNGVLYAGEVNYSPEDLEGNAPRIEQVLKSGQAVMVQVTKDPMGGKGARLTAQISLPGRFLVFAPNQNLSGISRRLPDEERKKLKTILKKVKPAEHGVIVRTAAEGASEDAITHDLQRLIAQWDAIQKQAKKVKAPDVLSEEPELTVRVVRDLFTDEEYKALVTDSPRVYDKVMDYVRDVAPDLAPKVSLHEGKLPAFEEHRIEEQIHKALDRKVWLPSGGYLIIERTEAMTIVDVNTGKSVGKTNLEATVANTNLEAAKEVARQLRLRDIGGIIVIDFIDMLLEKNKKQVEDTMKEALAIDKTRSQVFEIGPLGLMQVTRKRVSGGLVESFSETCPTCEGRGILVNYEI